MICESILHYNIDYGKVKLISNFQAVISNKTTIKLTLRKLLSLQNIKEIIIFTEPTSCLYY